jgi:thymidylate synthase (FAD)
MSPNEISRRYTSKFSEDFYIPDNIRLQDKINKQSSFESDDEELKKYSIDKIKEAYDASFEIYQELLKKGVAREMARMVLPVGQYTQFYLTTNARALMHFLNLRADEHAQWEIQQYALALGEFFKNICPWTYESFLNFDYSGNLLK